MKFSDYAYKRPEFERIKEEQLRIAERIAGAATFEEADAAFIENEKLNRSVETMATLASIRFTLNTADEFYKAEQDYFDETLPLFQDLNVNVSKTVLASKFKPDFEKKYGKMLITQLEVALKRMDPRLIPLMQEENRLSSEYSALTSAMSVMYQGEECNNYGLLKYMEDKDRDIRRGAFHAWAGWFADNEKKLGEIYDKLVRLRNEMGKLMGYDTFTPLGYLNMGRTDYGPDDVAKYRDQVVRYIVPVCVELRRRQSKRLGLKKLSYFDEQLLFAGGNADPIGDRDFMVKAASRMYHEMSKETGEFFDFMCEHELMDLDTKPNKAVGGYCTFIPDYDSPYIFSNFNGSAADVGVLTHEAGHAFEAFTAARHQPLLSYYWGTSEVCEIHSMSMEFFAYPWLKLFFGDGVIKNRYAHIMQAITFIPYGCCVDEYQHIVYQNPDMTPEERTAVWKKLEAKYMPDRDYDGVEVMEKGGFWMQKLHIFTSPFYYIDYTLASIGSFEFFGRMQEDRERAWSDYYRLCCAGGSQPYLSLLKLANLSNPFEEGAVQRAAAPLIKALEEIDDMSL